MDDHTALSLLEELADKLGIPIRYELITDELTGLGGLCRVEGKFILMIHSRATAKEKIQIMTEALRRVDLNEIYVRPALRELLDEYDKQFT
jgi:N-dimethylarginine dimethylaminohydrolase